MEVTQEQKAPGCYAAASVFGSDSAVCKACVAYEACGAASLETLKRIQNVINVEDLLKRHAAARQKNETGATALARPVPLAVSHVPPAKAKPIDKPVERKTSLEKVVFAISDDDQHVLAKLEKQKKARDQALILCKQGKIEECRVQLPRGINPFDKSGPAFLRVVCDMLINGGFTMTTLKERYVKEFEWTDGTASSHWTIAASLLLAFGITTGKDGGFVLNPKLACDNL